MKRLASLAVSAVFVLAVSGCSVWNAIFNPDKLREQYRTTDTVFVPTNANVDSLLRAKFTSIQVYPEYRRPLSNNIAHPDPQTAKNQLNTLAGTVFLLVSVIPNDTTTLRLEESEYNVLRNDYKVDLKTSDKDIIFSRIIDQGFKTDVSALSAVKANIGIDEKAQVVYETIQTANIDRQTGIDINKVRAVKSKQWNSSVREVYVATGITLNRLSSIKYKKIGAGAQITGLAFSANGELYQNASETQNFYEVILSGYRLGLEEEIKKDSLQIASVARNNSISSDSLKSILLNSKVLEQLISKPNLDPTLKDFLKSKIGTLSSKKIIK